MKNEINQTLLEIVEHAEKRNLPLETLLAFLKDEETHIFGGKIFKSFNAACSYFEVDGASIYRKEKESGISKSDILKEKIEVGIQKREIYYKGETHLNFTALCKAYGVDIRKARALVGNRKISRLEAFKIALANKEKMKNINK